MGRCLIVANQTLDTDELTEAVRHRIAAGAIEFYVVVPATPLTDQAAVPGAYADQGPSPQDRAYALAHQRLDQRSRPSRARRHVGGGVGARTPWRRSAKPWAGSTPRRSSSRPCRWV